MSTGTHDISQLLATRFQSVVEYGVDRIATVLQNDLAAHNAIMTDMVSGLCEVTTDRQRRYGESRSAQMVEVDEYGRSATQRTRGGSTVGFPLRLFQYALGWTEKWMQNRTPADMAEAMLTAQKAHRRQIYQEIQRAVFGSTNYAFTDHLVDNVDLAVKRLVNADSMAIPDGPNGETFNAATHTHYDANASLTTTVASALIDDVTEHGHTDSVKVVIARANEAAWKALTGFEAYQDPRMIFRATDTPAQTLDITKIDNRAIGLYGGAEVWVKPWGIANYAFAWDSMGPKPLAFRQRAATALQGLRIASTISTFPLTAEYMEAEFGIGVWERTNGAVLYFGGGSYAVPTI